MANPRRKRLGFLTDPTIEFEFYLAQKLGMTVARLRAEMSNAEFVQWASYYRIKAQREELETLKAKSRSKGGRRR